MKQQFPDMILEYKKVVQEEGNVVTSAMVNSNSVR